MKQTNKNLFLLLIILIAYSCKNNNVNKKETQSNLQENVTEQENINITENDAEFQLFWTEFRNAVINSDYNSLQNKVNFPLEIEDYQDCFPIINSGTENFEFVFNEYLILHHEAALNFIKECERVNVKKDRKDKEFVRMEDMGFKKINSEWKLSLIYMDTRDLIKKIKNKRKAKENIFMDTVVMEEFQPFWEEFRTGMINSDYESLKKHVQFPLSVWGFGPFELNSDDFVTLFNIFLKGEKKDNVIPYDRTLSNLEYIKNINIIDEALVFSTSEVRIGMMIFKKINSKWNLTQIYVNAYILEEKIKALRQ